MNLMLPCGWQVGEQFLRHRQPPAMPCPIGCRTAAKPQHLWNDGLLFSAEPNLGEAPSTNLQAPEKPQTSSSNRRGISPGFRRETAIHQAASEIAEIGFGFWCLEPGAFASHDSIETAENLKTRANSVSGRFFSGGQPGFRRGAVSFFVRAIQSCCRETRRARRPSSKNLSPARARTGKSIFAPA